MNRLILVAAVTFTLVTGVGVAAPDRKPHGPPPMEEAQPIALNQLPKDAMVTFGQWTIGHTSHENGIIVIHQQTRFAVYLPWASNGWINYRTPDGNSHILWSKGGSDRQQRDYEVERLLGKAALGRVGPGEYTFQSWKVTVTDEAIQFHCSSMGCNMMIRRNEAIVTHNGRTLGGAK